MPRRIGGTSFGGTRRRRRARACAGLAGFATSSSGRSPKSGRTNKTCGAHTSALTWLEREVELRNRASGAAATSGREADLAPIDPGLAELQRRREARQTSKAIINGEEVEVIVPTNALGVSPVVQKYGVESRHVPGSRV